MWQSVEIWTISNKNLLKKLEYGLLVENTERENASFPYKTAISEANVKTNWIVNTK